MLTPSAKVKMAGSSFDALLRAAYRSAPNASTRVIGQDLPSPVLLDATGLVVYHTASAT
jgi:hypothetical protein